MVFTRNKAAFASPLDYSRIVVNQTINASAYPAVVTVSHNLGYVPQVRAWAELYDGEVSYFFVSSVQYLFMQDYDTAGIYGILVHIDQNNVYIENQGTSTKKVYIRVYR